MSDTDLAFESVIQSVEGHPARLLRLMGLTVNLRKVYADRAARYNWQRKSRKVSIERVMRLHISEDEKRQMLLNAILDRGLETSL